ncbi:Tungstate-binding protein TupA [Tepidimonas alkaliphilus]|uniref:Tungstate-binding protein TupA n=1 Tax=Tepidimonas alkaliphilus TaxID=2588942 RepID=A0A554W8N2_9BURK|nr:substrate-binding domain-containing protein [Tepidimonas alkaliphilus]TSE19929.1 Tungstate-binding protein TupA [Tepidimonas alkaliphilus]
MRRRGWLLATAAVGCVGPARRGWAAAPTVVLATTTSVEHSGLMAHLRARLRQDTGIELRVVAVGTGQAVELVRRGDADLLLGHDAQAETALVAQGHGLRRIEVMVNDLLMVGPRHDPAGARGGDAVQALQRIAAAGAPWISRADRSGTHMAEQRLWALAGGRGPIGRGHRACGCGMGPALQMAAALAAYTLADRATWASFRHRAELTVLVQGDARLRNPYAVVVTNPRRHPHVQAEWAQRVADWLAGPRGQAAIAAFRLHGEMVFQPVAASP